MDMAEWNKRYSESDFVWTIEPNQFVVAETRDLRPGRAMDVAAGEGRNAVFLAEHGFDVVAVDISAKGLEKARQLARERGVELDTRIADLRAYDLGREQYDLITKFYYYEPALFPKVMTALKPGGFFIFQTFSVDQPATNRFGPRNPAFLVKPNELLMSFAGYRIRYYEDNIVDLNEGMHRGRGAVVRLVVEKSEVAPE